MTVCREKEEQGDLRKMTGWEACCLHSVSVVKVGKVGDQEVGMEGHAFMLTNCTSPWSETHLGFKSVTGQNLFLPSASLTPPLGQLWCLLSGQPQEEVSLFDVDLGESIVNARQGVVTNCVYHFNKGTHFFLTEAVWSFGKSVVMQTKQISTLKSVKYKTAGKAGWQDLMLFTLKSGPKKNFFQLVDTGCLNMTWAFRQAILHIMSRVWQ